MIEGLFTGPNEESFKSKEEIMDAAPFTRLTPLPREKTYAEMSTKFQKFRKEEEQPLRHIEIEFKNPVSIAFIGDQHIGHPSTFYDRIEQEIEHIVKTPNLYCVLLGDSVDGFFFNPAQMEEMLQVPEQYEYIQSMIKYLGSNKKLLATWGGDHDCLDEETEVYTKELGWISYDRLEDSHHLLTTREDGTLEYHKYERKIVAHHTGKMVSYESPFYSFLGTTNHRVMTISRRTNKVSFINAGDIGKTEVCIPVSGIMKNSGVDLSDDELYFLGFCLTDASIVHKRIILYQSKLRILEKLTKILSSLGYEYSESVKNKHRDSICGLKVKSLLPAHIISIRVKSSEKIVNILKGNNHKIPDIAYSMNPRQFEIFLSGMVDGDGSSRDGKMLCFYRKDKQMIDELQALCIMNGIGASVYDYIGRSGNVQYRLNIHKRRKIRLGLIHEEVDYSGKIWDVSIPPNRNFLVRRHGRAYFTGNSWAKRMGTNPHETMAKEAGAYYMEGLGYMTIKVPGKEWKVAAAHRLPGFSMYNKTHPQLRAERMGGARGADLIVAGHTHQKGISQDSVTEFGGVSRKVHYVSVGPYKQTDEYARKLGLSPLDTDSMFGVAAHFNENGIFITDDILRVL